VVRYRVPGRQRLFRIARWPEKFSSLTFGRQETQSGFPRREHRRICKFTSHSHSTHAFRKSDARTHVSVCSVRIP
jgi:hypothetical protein